MGRWEGRAVFKEEVKYGIEKINVSLWSKLKKTERGVPFSPKPEMETVLLLEDFLKTLLTLELGEPFSAQPTEEA